MARTTRRVCSRSGCGAWALPGATRALCPEHTAEREIARGSSAARGYDAAHRAERERWAPIVAAGQVLCARCRRPIAPGAAWTLDHDDDDRSRYLGPSHERCNAEAAGRASQRYRGQR